MTGWRALLVGALMLLPRAAAACSACLSSPYGDRTYNWALLGLILTPLVMTLAIGGLFAFLAWRRHRADATADHSTVNLSTLEETT